MGFLSKTDKKKSNNQESSNYFTHLLKAAAEFPFLQQANFHFWTMTK